MTDIRGEERIDGADFQLADDWESQEDMSDSPWSTDSEDNDYPEQALENDVKTFKLTSYAGADDEEVQEVQEVSSGLNVEDEEIEVSYTPLKFGSKDVSAAAIVNDPREEDSPEEDALLVFTINRTGDKLPKTILKERTLIRKEFVGAGFEVLLLNSCLDRTELLVVVNDPFKRKRVIGDLCSRISSISNNLETFALFINPCRENQDIVNYLNQSDILPKVDGEGTYTLSIEYSDVKDLKEFNRIEKDVKSFQVLTGGSGKIFRFLHILEFQAAYVDLSRVSSVEFSQSYFQSPLSSFEESDFLFLQYPGSNLDTEIIDLIPEFITKKITVKGVHRIGTSSAILKLDLFVERSHLIASDAFSLVLLNIELVAWDPKPPGYVEEKVVQEEKKKLTKDPNKKKGDINVIKKKIDKPEGDWRIIKDEISALGSSSKTQNIPPDTLNVVSVYTKEMSSEADVQELRDLFKPHGNLFSHCRFGGKHVQRARLDFILVDATKSKQFLAGKILNERRIVTSLSGLGLDFKPELTESEVLKVSLPSNGSVVCNNGLPPVKLREDSGEVIFVFESCQELNLQLLKNSGGFHSLGELKADKRVLSLRSSGLGFYVQCLSNCHTDLRFSHKSQVFKSYNEGHSIKFTKGYIVDVSKEKPTAVSHDGTTAQPLVVLEEGDTMNTLAAKQISRKIQVVKPSIAAIANTSEKKLPAAIKDAGGIAGQQLDVVGSGSGSQVAELQRQLADKEDQLKTMEAVLKDEKQRNSVREQKLESKLFSQTDLLQSKQDIQEAELEKKDQQISKLMACLKDERARVQWLNITLVSKTSIIEEMDRHIRWLHGH